MTSPRMMLLLTAFSIFSLGLIMIFSTTSAEILDHELDKSTHQAIIKQLLYALAGLALAWGIIKVGYQKLLDYSTALLVVFIFLLVLTLVPGIGREVNGSRRWLNLAGLSFQPSEFVKYVIPAYFIQNFLKYEPEEFYFKDFIKLVGTLSVPMVLVLVEPNNGTTAVIGLTLVALFLLTRIHFRYWAWPLLGFVFVVGGFASQLPYVSARINVYLHPELDLKGKGHQPYQAKIAAGSGQLMGKGPGNSLQKLSYLPEAQNDYIAAIYAEEFGFMGVLGVITLYLIMASLGFYIAYQCPDRGGYFLACCAIFLISFQAFLNLGVVSGLLPSTGLNLPLFSQGGSSLMANITGLALLFSISIESDKARMVHA
ncbi:MAG TPA: putative lipid II flippase FtsW [Parachlamydiaceae bacterium]|nr:putative lipid II flippase FtsW [Parachlamydiaceae bacterium]